MWKEQRRGKKDFDLRVTVERGQCMSKSPETEKNVDISEYSRTGRRSGALCIERDREVVREKAKGWDRGPMVSRPC